MRKQENRIIESPIEGEIRIPEINPNQIELDNGRRLYYFQKQDMDILKIEFFFHHGGTIYQDKTFVSALTNNQIAEGTSEKTSKEIAEALDYYGCFVEKSLDKEAASIAFYFLNQYSDEVMPWIESIILDSVFPQEELSLIIPKLKQQFLVNNQRTDYIARTRLQESIFGKDSLYGLIGEMEEFDLVERQDIQGFYSSNYLNQPFSIIVSGAYKESLVNHINKAFGVQGLSNVQPIANTDIIQGRPEKLSINLSSAVQSSIALGKVLPAIQDKDYFSLLVLNNIIGGYFGSRLMTNIREDKGYTYGIGSGIQPFSGFSLFYIMGDVKSDHTQASIDEVYYEIERLSKEAIDKEELNLVKNNIMGKILSRLDGPIDISTRFKTILRHNLGMEYFQDYINKVKSIAPEEIGNMAKTYLQANDLTEIRVGNETIMR